VSTTVQLLLLLLPAASPFDEAMARADALRDAARAAPENTPERVRAVAAALGAYAELLEEHGKDPKLMPRIRRRRVALLRAEGRVAEAVAELDAIVEGRARRKDRAKALLDAGALFERAEDLARAAERYRRAVEDFTDIVRVRADAALALGRVYETIGRAKDAERRYRYVVEKCRDEAPAVIGAYDALALMALRAGDVKGAHRWLRRCVDRYEKRAARDDGFGAMVGRLLGRFKAPRGLAVAAAMASEPEVGDDSG
jgi:tetratricopeptide (TPR) repeat protein